MRAFLGGKGIPREEFAIVGIGESSGAPAILLLEDGEVFTPEDYISLGYTNYEAWCVGASGGRGGDAVDAVEWRTMKTQEVMPSDIWADLVNEYVLIAGSSTYQYFGTSPLGTTMPPAGVHSWTVGGSSISWSLYPEGLAWLQNPGQIADIIHYLEPKMFYRTNPYRAGHEYFPFGANDFSSRYIGGGGGGGGMHVAHGLLSDLPAALSIEVGQQGADGAPGQAKQPAPLDPSPAWLAVWYPRMSQARWDFLHRFPNGHPTIGAPAEGSPGGASSFGDIAKASGGKGGKPAIQWAGSTRQQYAYGGQGGIGGTDVPGGGADGATTSSSPGKDGGWDGSVGKGGGGGRGGISGRGGSGGLPAVPPVLATEGGRGSLNFADTSVYGARGPLGTYSQLLFDYNPVTGDLIAVVESLIESQLNPGSGGGARIPGNRKYGSRAQGYSHDGAVLVRLTKLV